LVVVCPRQTRLNVLAQLLEHLTATRTNHRGYAAFLSIHPLNGR